jgi:hypothetical protein
MNNWVYFYFMLAVFFTVCGGVGWAVTKINAPEPADH